MDLPGQIGLRYPISYLIPSLCALLHRSPPRFVAPKSPIAWILSSLNEAQTHVSRHLHTRCLKRPWTLHVWLRRRRGLSQERSGRVRELPRDAAHVRLVGQVES